MNIIKLFFLTIVISSCSEQQLWQEIEVGKTFKIVSNNFKLNNTNYIYKWSKPIGSEESESKYSIENDKLLFTPLTEGTFTIDLEIENMMQTRVHQETFYFNVIKNSNSSVVEISDVSKEEKNIIKKDPQISKPKKSIIINNRYTIQVASWTSFDKAKEDMDELINLGFDTYLEEYFDTKNNVTRWRVRIGSFENRALAQEVKNKLAKFRGETPWIAYIK